MKFPRWLKWTLGAAAFAGTAYGIKRATHQEEIGGDPGVDDVTPPADVPPPDTLFYPVPSGKVTSPFGQRTDPTTGATTENHNGVDFRAPEGTPLRAPGPGTVTRVWSDDLNGNAFRIKVGDKTFGFAHMQSVDVKSGDTFAAGDVLGHTGGGGPHEGKSTGPHLHMVMLDSSGAHLDPMSVTWSAQA
jgi:murein DD-endopeptidase MepM/ murein hydrolase activator NlpD